MRGSMINDGNLILDNTLGYFIKVYFTLFKHHFQLKKAQKIN